MNKGNYVSEARMIDIANEIGSKPSDISSPISRLKEMMVVVKEEDGEYTIVDRVFNTWLAGEYIE